VRFIGRGFVDGDGISTISYDDYRVFHGALVPFVEATVFHDSQGFDWDNRATVGGGVKAIIPRDRIYTEVGASYLHETRFRSGLAASGLSVFTTFSFNWNFLGQPR